MPFSERKVVDDRFGSEIKKWVSCVKSETPSGSLESEVELMIWQFNRGTKGGERKLVVINIWIEFIATRLDEIPRDEISATLQHVDTGSHMKGPSPPTVPQPSTLSSTVPTNDQEGAISK